MKKYLSLLLACVLALALLCACGKKDAAEQYFYFVFSIFQF